MSSERSKPRVIGTWVFVGLLTAIFLASATGKFVGLEQMVTTFEKAGLEDERLMIGIGETISALLYLSPLTCSLGVLLLSAHMGGAIVVHMGLGEPYIVQSIILLLVWVGYYLRRPEMLASFTAKKNAGD